MAARDHHARGSATPGQFDVRAEVHHRRGHKAQIDHIDPARAEAICQRCQQFRAGQAAVAADHHCGLALGACCGAEGTADEACGVSIDGFSDDAADVVGFEDGGVDAAHAGLFREEEFF